MSRPSFPPRRALVCVACATRAPPWKTLAAQFITYPTRISVQSDGASSIYPDVPTLREQGVKDLSITTWWGIVAPAGTPEPIIKLLNKQITEVTQRDAMKARLASEGAEAYQTTPAEFKKILGDELATWTKVAKTANIKPE